MKIQKKKSQIIINRLSKWLETTQDPWRCSPHGVLQDKGEYKDDPKCLTLGI